MRKNILSVHWLVVSHQALNASNFKDDIRRAERDLLQSVKLVFEQARLLAHQLFRNWSSKESMWHLTAPGSSRNWIWFKLMTRFGTGLTERVLLSPRKSLGNCHGVSLLGSSFHLRMDEAFPDRMSKNVQGYWELPQGWMWPSGAWTFDNFRLLLTLFVHVAVTESAFCWLVRCPPILFVKKWHVEINFPKSILKALDLLASASESLRIAGAARPAFDQLGQIGAVPAATWVEDLDTDGYRL